MGTTAVLVGCWSPSPPLLWPLWRCFSVLQYLVAPIRSKYSCLQQRHHVSGQRRLSPRRRKGLASKHKSLVRRPTNTILLFFFFSWSWLTACDLCRSPIVCRDKTILQSKRTRHCQFVAGSTSQRCSIRGSISNSQPLERRLIQLSVEKRDESAQSGVFREHRQAFSLFKLPSNSPLHLDFHHAAAPPGAIGE